MPRNPIPPPTGYGGRRAVKGLFVEFKDNYPDAEPIYSLQEFHDVFLEERDITETRAALRLVGSLREWELIKRDWPGFVTLIEDWKVEVEALLKADAMQKVIELLGSDNKAVALSAAKFLATAEYNKGKTKREREKERKKQEDLLAQQMETKDDWSRVKELLDQRNEAEVN